jgi:lysophospholipase L1-like esterase
VKAGQAATALVVWLGACTAVASVSVPEGALRYVALGDSYTIGTSVSTAESWPSQLVARVPELRLVVNLGVNGYTSGDLIEDELPALPGLQPEFITLMIGVNDVVQGVPEAKYRANIEEILDATLALVGADRLLCVATPDYTVTPQGGAFGSPDQQRAGIQRVNALLGEACRARGIRFVPEIFEISTVATGPSFIAGDGLHPSGLQYARWVDAIRPVVEELLLPSGDR